MRVCVCVCVCVCHNEKRGRPDEWQARQATQAILQVSSSKHNAKKITTRVRGPFHQSITAILTEEKREEKQFTKPTHVAVYLFRDLDRLCVCVCGRGVAFSFLILQKLKLLSLSLSLSLWNVDILLQTVPAL